MVMNGPLLAGCAELDITPPFSSELAGHFEPRVAREVEIPLMVKAIALSVGGQTIILVTCDLVYLRADIVTAAKDGIQDATGVGPASVVVSCTHTHSGPETIGGSWFAAVDHRYLEWVTQRIRDVALLAFQRRKAARISVGQSPVEGVCFNRRYLTKDGQIVAKGEPNSRPGPVDPMVTAMLVEDESGATLAIWANVAVHYVGSDRPEAISADYYGHFSRAAKRLLGDHVVAMVSNGASGDVNNVDPRAAVPVHGTARAALVARGVLGSALAATSMARRSSEVQVSVALLPILAHRYEVSDDDVEMATRILDAAPGDEPEAWFSFSARGPVPARLGRRYAEYVHLLQDLPATQPTVLGVLSIGDLCLIAMPGEVFVEHGLRLKRSSPYEVTAVVGLANDCVGYLPTLEAFELGGYEAWRTPISWTAPGTGEAMVEAVLEYWESGLGHHK